jgi:8-oxo-dGTP diphosphatase
MNRGGHEPRTHAPYSAAVSHLESWRFCPRCRTELEAGPGRASCPACALVAYANPAPTACAAVLDDLGRVLLARRAGDVFGGCWDLPGGFVEEDEHPLDTIRRELREETGLLVEPGEFIGVWMDRYSEDDSGPSTLNLYWTARAAAGEARAADDVSELRWFPLDELPPAGEIAFHIADVLARVRNEHP